jgi:hypothetical protein
MGETEKKTAEKMPNSSGWHWVVMGGFIALTAVGVVLSTGQVTDGLLDGSMAATETPSTVPPSVYLYATLGALGYIFTRLINVPAMLSEMDDAETLARIGLRIPAAWVLAAGIYLLGETVLRSGMGGQGLLLAGLPFLVGLYVNVALKSLGAVADKLLGNPSRTSDSEA